MNPPLAHPCFLSDEALLDQCEIRRQRRSGPGGQHRNKVETGVVITHLPTGLKAEATERRSQADNLRTATFRLRLRLAREHRTAVDEHCEPWRRRTAGGRISINSEHAEFPMLLAHALNVLSDSGWRPSEAAARLSVTSSQLIRLLRKDPATFEYLNRRRAELGLGALR